MKRLCLTDAYPIGLLRPHPLNYREHDLDALGRSLARGQHRTVAVRADDASKPLGGGTLLAGHGVWYACQRLGLATVAATVVECSDGEAEEIVVEDNRWQELGTNDPEKLAALLEGLQERDRLAAVGYTPDDLEDVLAAAGRNVTAPEEFRGGYAETPEETAARTRGEGSPINPVRQVVLIFQDGDSYATFQRQVAALREEYDLEESGTTPVVVEAVARELGPG